LQRSRAPRVQEVTVARRTFKIVIVAALILAGSAAVSGAAAPDASADAAVSAPRQVTLVTGDIVTVSTLPDGRQQAAVVRKTSAGPGGLFQTFNVGSDLYVVPQSVIPYLGSTMDLALFDVTKLAESASGTTAVQVTYRSSTSPTAVPGIQITQRSGTSAQGVVTPASGPAFGAAIARQWLADHDSATHTSGMFASVARIGSASAARPVVSPNFVMHTLTVNGRDAKGKKDTGDNALIYNVDDMRAFISTPTFVKGVAKVSVPAGHYAAFGVFFDFQTGIARLVAMPEFSVTADMTITLDARAATAPVSITTPKPANAFSKILGLGRTDTMGQSGTFQFLGGAATSYVVQPTTTPVTIGQFHYYVAARMFSPADATTSYSYDVEFPSDGAIGADQHYVVSGSNVAAVDSRYPASHENQPSIDSRFGALAWQQFLFADLVPFTTPTQRAEYYSADPRVSWSGSYYASYNEASFQLLGIHQTAWRTYSPGTSFAATWGGPLGHPRLLEHDLYLNQTLCPACISDTRLDLLAFPFSDNTPDHFGFPDGAADGLTESVTYGVYADDALVRSGGFLDTEVTVPAGAQRYRIDYDNVRSSTDFTLSTDVQTRWTVSASAPRVAPPAGWVCTIRANPPASCGVLPLVTADYSLPVGLLGQLGSGPVSGTLQLGHLAGASIAFSTVTVSVSFDGGQSWQPVTVTDLGGGAFGIGLTVPAASTTDGFGALRVSVQDAAGGTFDQTIQHAFAVSAQ
jgi:hypothetical protein